MSLKFASIKDVYPDWNECSSSRTKLSEIKNIYTKESIKDKSPKLPVIIEETEEELPEYTEKEIDELDELRELKPYQKLRTLNNKLVIDTRIFPSIRRYFSKDTRNDVLKELQFLATLNISSVEKLNIIYNTIEILKTSTYKKDSKWVEKANLFINSRFII